MAFMSPIEREIAELDALSRTRALTNGESLRLEKLIRLTTRPRHYTTNRTRLGAGREAARIVAERRRA